MNEGGKDAEDQLAAALGSASSAIRSGGPRFLASGCSTQYLSRYALTRRLTSSQSRGDGTLTEDAVTNDPVRPTTRDPGVELEASQGDPNGLLMELHLFRQRGEDLPIGGFGKEGGVGLAVCLGSARDVSIPLAQLGVMYGLRDRLCDISFLLSRLPF